MLFSNEIAFDFVKSSFCLFLVCLVFFGMFKYDHSVSPFVEIYILKAEHLMFEQYIICEGYADLLIWFLGSPLWHFLHVSMKFQILAVARVYLLSIETNDKTAVNFKDALSRPERSNVLIQLFYSLLLKDHIQCLICKIPTIKICLPALIHIQRN